MYFRLFHDIVGAVNVLTSDVI